MKKRISLVGLLILAAGMAAAQNSDMVRAHDAINYAGDFAMVCGVIADANYALNVRGEPTYLNFDKPYPDHDFTAIVWGRDRRNFSDRPESLKGLKACVYGKVKIYKGKAQIVLIKPEQLSVARPKKPAEENGDSPESH